MLRNGAGCLRIAALYSLVSRIISALIQILVILPKMLPQFLLYFVNFFPKKRLTFCSKNDKLYLALGDTEC